MIRVVPYRRSYRKQILRLIRSSDSTPRTEQTWREGRVTAMLALRGRRLIGAIPFEKRKLSLGGGRLLNVLWVSGAHVEARYRNRGIGTAMDVQIAKHFCPKFKAVFAFRQDEGSAAYRWYRRVGYTPALSILSLKKNVVKPVGIVSYELFDDNTQIAKSETELLTCFRRCFGRFGGYEKRHRHFWTDKLKYHYYRNHYRYSVVALRRGRQVEGYVFLGRTSLRDRIDRLDILELVCPQGKPAVFNRLLDCVFDQAWRQKVREIRIQLASHDSWLPIVARRGFVNRWQTYMIGRTLDSKRTLRKLCGRRNWKYFQLDYV